MANQVVVSPLLQLVSDKLAKLIEKDFGVAWGVQKQMKKLSKTLSKIKYVLVDAERKQVTDLEIRNWLQELKDVSYEADDVFEKWEYEGLLQVFPEMSNNHSLITDSLEELMESFDDIAKESREFDLRKGVPETSYLVPHQQICPGRETGSILTEQVFGREGDKQKLVSLLLDQHQCRPTHPRSQMPLPNKANSLKHISVCPIVGIGGLGKTTLAQLVYNDERVEKHFDNRSWVCVSDDFDVKRLIRAIITSLSETACDFEDMDRLQHGLQDKLRGKRYLLVLDDVWEDDQDKWNKLKGTLACGAEGSCVIVTTRLENVAIITGTLPHHPLQPLSKEDCWSLFKERAFGSEERERPDLTRIGKKIVKKCKGVPLAAKALGASLRFKRKPQQWLHVNDSEIWQLVENGILPALRLSYNHMSPQLRQCFTYCAIYKKDHEIDREELISLWIANGFVKSKGSMERLEDDGNEIFKALLWRSFFQDITKGEDGDIRTCKMHDLVHDLACDVGGNECCIVDGRNTENITRRTRHLSYIVRTKRQPDPPPLSPKVLRKCPPSLRSLLIREKWSLGPFEMMSQLIFPRLIRLRALDLSGTMIRMLPDTIGDMKHLRYLNLSSNPIRSLPESICKLINLETLNLRKCHKLVRLPKDMSEMRRLRHLDNGYCDKLVKMPIGMGKLTCLQTLSNFAVGLESGGGINELGGLNKIGGVLKISGLKNVRNPMDAKEANLLQKENLCSLELMWCDNYPWYCTKVKSWLPEDEDEEIGRDIATAATEVMKGLQPPPNLRRFVVEDYNGVSFPSLLLPKLVEMTLSVCSRLKFVDEGGDALAAGGFMSLEELHLRFMSELEGWSSLSSSSSQTGGGEGDHQQKAEAVGKVVIPKRRLLTRAPPVTINSQSLLPSSSFSSSQQQAVEDAAQAEAAKLLFPCLKKLRLGDCPKLTSIPLPSSVESVILQECNQSVLGQLKDLPRLSNLEIERIYELKCFPQGMLLNLTALQNLVIKSCSKVEAFSEGLIKLSSLRSLYIGECDCLKQLPKLDMSCLISLEIRNCPGLEFNMKDDFQNLVALETLDLQSIPKLARFPEGIKQAVMLKQLSIRRCSEEKVMDLPEWIGTLTKLQELSIVGCKNRKVLPEGMQHLTALRELTIWGCGAELKRRCKRDTGEDRSKIAHVQKISILASDMVASDSEDDDDTGLLHTHFEFVMRLAGVSRAKVVTALKAADWDLGTATKDLMKI